MPVTRLGEQQPVVCRLCNKSYRQHNSFFKHLWEHHPYWKMIHRRFRLSKHGQTLLMQSAEVLLSFRKPHVYGSIPTIKSTI